MPRLVTNKPQLEGDELSKEADSGEGVSMDLETTLYGGGTAPVKSDANPQSRRPRKRPIPAFQIVVMMERRASTARSAAASPRLGETLVDMLVSGEAIDVFADEATRGTAAHSSATNTASDPLPRVFAVDATDERKAREMLELLTSENPSATVYVAPPRSLQPRTTQARVSGARAASAALPPKVLSHWGMTLVGVDSLTIDASQVRVAVVDSGVDEDHPDLKDAIESYDNFTSESKRDQSGHGTHVCGIIAARGDPATGMKGVCNARLLVYKGLGKYYQPDVYFQALQKAIDGPAAIVNLSLGGSDEDPLETVLIQRAVRKGKTVIAAMGNDFDVGNPTFYPASLEGVIAVGAIGDACARGTFSNTGSHIALVAQGVQILSTAPTTPGDLFGKRTLLAECDGTSMSAPFVTGVAALLAAQAGNGTGIRAKLHMNPCPGQTSHDEELGWGYLCWTGVSTLPP